MNAWTKIPFSNTIASFMKNNWYLVRLSNEVISSLSSQGAPKLLEVKVGGVKKTSGTRTSAARAHLESERSAEFF